LEMAIMMASEDTLNVFQLSYKQSVNRKTVENV
jgi:hypothetical protein